MKPDPLHAWEVAARQARREPPPHVDVAARVEHTLRTLRQSAISVDREMLMVAVASLAVVGSIVLVGLRELDWTYEPLYTFLQPLW